MPRIYFTDFKLSLRKLGPTKYIQVRTRNLHELLIVHHIKYRQQQKPQFQQRAKTKQSKITSRLVSDKQAFMATHLFH